MNDQASLPDALSVRFDPGIFRGHHAVLFVCATEHIEWAGHATWEMARLAAADGRRVALIDLSLRNPVLDRGMSTPPREGITDAFLTDASISEAARQDGHSTLHYLGAGTATRDPTVVWSHPRWRRLVSGFRSEDALLIGFVPPQALPVLAIPADGVVLLADDDYDLTAEISPGIVRFRDRGPPILHIHRPLTVGPGGGGATPDPTPSSPPTTPVASPDPRRFLDSIRSSPGRVAAAVVVAALAIAASVVLGRRDSTDARDVPVGDPIAAPTPQPIDTPATATAPPAAPDTAYYGVQVAAFNTAGRALRFANEVAGDEFTVTVSPVRRGPTEVWYRVIAGFRTHAAAADSLRRRLWSSGRVENQQGTVIRVPQALSLGRRGSPDDADREAQGLREQGIPAYVVRAPDGAHILVGAFEFPEQAVVAESLLTAAGLTATLAPRAGISP